MEFTDGIYLINKPRGRSSFSIVAQVRRLSGIKKVGHAGTLDPEAEGLLIVMVGKDFTKKSDSYLKLDKSYEFEVKFGETSTTGDEQGEKLKVGGNKPTTDQIELALGDFFGEIEQMPPQYSAIKVNGVRAYKLARDGKVADIKARKVVIDDIVLLDYKYPFARFATDVSSGTYIRSLAEDIGKSLGTGAYCTQIVRTRIGDNHIEEAITLD